MIGLDLIRSKFCFKLIIMGGTFLCFNLIGVVILTVLLFQTDSDKSKLESDINQIQHQSISLLSCPLLCPQYSYSMGQLCCTTYGSSNCQSKLTCKSEYIDFKKDQLDALQNNYFYYLLFDALLFFVLFVKLCKSLAKACKQDPRRNMQAAAARNRAIMALLFATRQAANQNANRPDRSILTQSFIAPDQTENCAICIDAFEQERVVSLNCTHTFHRACIEAWINRGDASCPVCRAPV